MGGSCWGQVYSSWAKILILLIPCIGPGLCGSEKIWLQSSALGNQTLLIRLSSLPALFVSSLSLAQDLERNFLSCVWDFVPPWVGMLLVYNSLMPVPPKAFSLCVYTGQDSKEVWELVWSTCPPSEDPICSFWLNFPQPWAYLSDSWVPSQGRSPSSEVLPRIQLGSPLPGLNNSV